MANCKPRKKNDKSQRESIKVMIRFRPTNSFEKKWDKQNKKTNINHKQNEIAYLAGSKIKLLSPNGKIYQYSFDTILTSSTTQRQAFETVAEQTCDEILQGYNGTIFVYGQSGSGKTHTMYGPEDQKDEMDITSFGIIPMSAAYIFTILNDATHPLSEDIANYSVRCEFIEIYNEKFADLLDPKQTPVIRELLINNKYIPVMQKITTKQVKNLEECIKCIRIATSNRTVARTNLNATSSRSHMVMRLIVTIETKDGLKKTGIGNFADLAGSEKVKKTGVRGKQLREAGNILKSLSVLSSVIDALEKGRKHIPFKDSKLTFMLKNSLGGNCKTTLLICASPHIHNREETIRSIAFGMRCRNVQNVVSTNVTRSKQQLIIENEALKKEIQALKSNAIATEEIVNDKLNEIEIENFDLLKQIENNEKNINTLTQQIQSMSIEKDEGMEREKHLNEELEILQEAYNELKLSINYNKKDEYEEEINHYKRKLTDLDTNNSDILNENKKLKIKNEELNAIINRLKTQIITKNDDINIFKEKYENQQKQMISLQSQLDSQLNLINQQKQNENKEKNERKQWDQQNEKNQQLLLKIDNLTIELNKEKNENKNLQISLKKFEDKSQRVTNEKYEIEDKLRILNVEYNDLKNRFNKFQEEINNETSKYKKNITNLKERVDQQRTENIKLLNNLKNIEKLETENNNKYEIKMEELEVQCEEQNNSIKQLNAKNKDLMEQIKQLQSEKDKLIQEKEASPSLEIIDSEITEDVEEEVASLEKLEKIKDEKEEKEQKEEHKEQEEKEETEQKDWDLIFNDGFHARTRSSAFLRPQYIKPGAAKVGIGISITSNTSNTSNTTNNQYIQHEIKYDDDGDAEELDKLERALKIGGDKVNGIEKYTRKKRKKYKKRSMTKNKTIDRKLLSPRSDRDRKMSKADVIVRRQTIALGSYFEHHLQVQKQKDEKMEKVFDAQYSMEQRKRTLSNQKKEIEGLNNQNNNNNKQNAAENDANLALKLQQQQLDLYQKAWLVHGYDEYMRQKSMHQYNIQHQIRDKLKNKNQSPSISYNRINGHQTNGPQINIQPPRHRNGIGIGIGVSMLPTYHHPNKPNIKPMHKHSASTHISQQFVNQHISRNGHNQHSTSVFHRKNHSEQLVKKKKHHKRKSGKIKIDKIEEAAKLSAIYDNEYKAMKRRYQQKKRKRFLSKANNNNNNNNNNINNNNHQSDAIIPYDSDYNLNNIDSPNVPLYD